MKKKITRYASVLWIIFIVISLCKWAEAEAPLLWKVPLGSEAVGSPAVGYGQIFITTRSGHIVCLTTAGKILWTANLSAAIFAPAMLAHKRLYVGDGNGKLHALTLTGQRLWEIGLEAPIRGTPQSLKRDLLVVNDQGTFFCIGREKGNIRVRREWGAPVMAPGIVDRKTKQFLVPTSDYRLLAASPDGRIIWQYRTVGVNLAVPALTRQCDILLASMDHHLYKLSPQGKLLWSFAAQYWLGSSPVVDAAGNAYVGGYDKFFYSLSPQGNERWKFAVQAPFTATATIDDAGNIYAGDSSGTIYAWSAEGRLLWQYKTEDFIRGGLTVMPSEKILLVGSIDGSLLAFQTAATLGKKAAWPKLLGNPANDSRRP